MKKKILVVVAHADDEVLGCGATINKHVAEQDEVHCIVLTDSDSSRENSNLELRKKHFRDSCHILGIEHAQIFNFPDNKLDTVPLLELAKTIEKYKKEFQPDILYTHCSADLNQDHTQIHKACMIAFRPMPGESLTEIRTFTIPSSFEWTGYQNKVQYTPNLFIEISQQQFEIKIKALQCYTNEIEDFPHPRSYEYLCAKVKLDGAQVGLKLAEVFFTERIIQRIE